MAPHQVYRCARDEWVAIAVGDDGDGSGLCAVLGRGDWIDAYSTAAKRRLAVDEIDAAISRWTTLRSAREAFESLHAAGVPAMAVMTNEALASDPHLAARGVFVEVDHAEIGRTRVMRAPWLFSDLDCAVTSPGPLLGQDNAYVLQQLLGLSAADVARLSEVLV